MSEKTSNKDGGEPERAMELLWGVHKEFGRGPKRALSVERIVEAAIELADEEGLEALSIRRVADRLGVGAMSLYTYVPGKAELIELMLDMVLGEAERPGGEESGWRDGLELYAWEGWKLYHRHPWMLQVPFSRGLLGPNQAALLDSVLCVVSGIGLDDGEMVAVSSGVAGYVQGAARTSVETVQTERTTGITDAEWWTTYGSLMAKYIEAERYPTLANIRDWGAFDEADDGFEFGLQRILDGIEAFVRARSAQPDRS